MIDLQSRGLLVVGGWNQLPEVAAAIFVRHSRNQALDLHRDWIKAAHWNNISWKRGSHNLTIGQCSARCWIINRAIQNAAAGRVCTNVLPREQGGGTEVASTHSGGGQREEG